MFFTLSMQFCMPHKLPKNLIKYIMQVLLNFSQQLLCMRYNKATQYISFIRGLRRMGRLFLLDLIKSGLFSTHEMLHMHSRKT